jgi:hypothetical protein
VVDEQGDSNFNPETVLNATPGAHGDQDSTKAILGRALRDADAFLAAGDPRAAFDATNLPELFDRTDERVLACAAESLMQFEPKDVGERLRREYVLSALLAHNNDPLPQRSHGTDSEGWDNGRVAAIRARAAQQLDIDTGVPSMAVSPTGETPQAEPSIG